MEGPENYFGENTVLDAVVNGRITRCLNDNAAEDASTRLSTRIMSSIRASDTPLRISDLPIIAYEHDAIPVRLYRDNPVVGSLSSCSSCHRQADAGLYDERTVVILGFGNWHD